MRLPSPAERYDARNEAEMRRALEQEIAALRAQLAELSRQIQTQRFGLGVLPSGQQPAIPGPTGGATIDTEARTAIDGIRVILQLFGFTA